MFCLINISRDSHFKKAATVILSAHRYHPQYTKFCLSYLDVVLRHSFQPLPSFDSNHSPALHACNLRRGWQKSRTLVKEMPFSCFLYDHIFTPLRIEVYKHCTSLMLTA